MKDDRLYRIHICECIDRINSYVKDIDRHTFMAPSLVQDAVLRNLQTMAESTQRLSDGFKNSHKTIEWYKIAGLRNLLVHDYLGVDLDTVWNIIVKPLKELRQVVDPKL